MKILKRSITVLVCLILFTSCTKRIDWKKEKSNFEVREEITYYKDKLFTGEIFENYDNGQLKFKRNFKDGELDGLDEIYYRNGQLKFKNNYKDGKQDGLYEKHFKNGQLKTKANHKDGKYDGLREEYYKNGQLKFKSDYKDGKKSGISLYYYKNGRLRLKTKDGERID